MEGENGGGENGEGGKGGMGEGRWGSWVVRRIKLHDLCSHSCYIMFN